MQIHLEIVKLRELFSPLFEFNANLRLITFYKRA